MFFFPFITAVSMFAIGAGVLWLNPRRAINRALATLCFLSVLVFAAQLTAKFLGARYQFDQSANPLPWIRLKFGLIGLISPLMVWVCYYVVSGQYSSRRDLLKKLTPWIALSAFLFVFPFTEGFKPHDSLPGNIRYGRFYLLYFGPMLAGQIAVCIASFHTARRLTGIRKLEFAFITIALCYLSLVAVTVEALFATWPNVPGLQPLTRVLSYLVYIVFGVSAWLVTSHRVYHSRQVLLSALQRLVVIAPLAVGTIAILSLIRQYEQSPYAAATVLGASILLFLIFDDRLRSRLKLKSEDQTKFVTQQFYAVADQESSPERLLSRFEEIIRAFTQARVVRIFQRDSVRFSSGRSIIPVAALSDAGFFDDGSYSQVARLRIGPHPRNGALEKILQSEELSVLIGVRWNDRFPTLLAGLGERENGLPFTYPEIRVLRELMELAESLYTRTRFGLQARQSEQLAAIGMLGASIAHELRNPMSVLRSFSQLLPENLSDREFLRQFGEIVPKETARIEVLAEQLLDLSRPRGYAPVRADIHGLIRRIVVFSQAQAAEAGTVIDLELRATQSVVALDESAIEQVLLNLLRNAFEALASVEGKRCIKVRTQNSSDTLLIEIEDNGPGIPPEVAGSLFTAFSSSGKPGGLGLGLAVSKEIVRVHHGEISVDTSRHNGGALFRVSLPLDNFPAQNRGKPASSRT